MHSSYSHFPAGPRSCVICRKKGAGKDNTSTNQSTLLVLQMNELMHLGQTIQIFI